MSVQLEIRAVVKAAMLLVPWACVKLAFVFCQMVLKLPCSLLKILSAVQNIPRAVKEVFHNYSDVDGELGDRKFTSSAVKKTFGHARNVYSRFSAKPTYYLGVAQIE